ncbi:MAG TPA: prenyltransferase/squalene oxidase repeat-containing protein [Chthoniobacteraceae bacterium]|jgi:hypothetical protein|nr:prenyltransferase/squalene oxidase repeat-containing protein [Chthoniobacteraceae bacterium]
MKSTALSRTILSTLILPLALGLSAPPLWAKEPAPGKKAAPAAQQRAVPAARETAATEQPKAPDAKKARPPEEAVRAGLHYLLEQQTKSGGWNQGGGWRQGQNGAGRVEGAKVEDPADLGNTCVSLMALLRAGETPVAGEHREAAQRAFEFICAQVEAADVDSLWATSVRDSQLQVKIGTYVDTFLTGWALSELKGKVAEGEPEKRRAANLEKVVAKIEKHQKEDGSFGENRGWAAVLSQGLASKALNTASRSGAKVSPQALARDNNQNVTGLISGTGGFAAAVPATEPSSAGVSLYRESAKLSGLQEKSRSNLQVRAQVEKLADDPAAPVAKRNEAKSQLQQFDADEKAFKDVQAGVATRSKQSQFVSGFGNNGGEEFLSYLNVGEALKEKGGADWKEWKAKMEKTICGAQNEDGSWAGQHCITGRTFCTSAALLTLLVEQAPSPRLTEAAPAKP